MTLHFHATKAVDLLGALEHELAQITITTGPHETSDLLRAARAHLQAIRILIGHLEQYEIRDHFELLRQGHTIEAPRDLFDPMVADAVRRGDRRDRDEIRRSIDNAIAIRRLAADIPEDPAPLPPAIAELVSNAAAETIAKLDPIFADIQRAIEQIANPIRYVLATYAGTEVHTFERPAETYPDLATRPDGFD